MSTEWKGTPAEWDAEFKRIVDAATSGFSAADVALKLLPPRPVEPPSVVTASGWTVTWDGAQFKASKSAYPTNYGINPLWVAHWSGATEEEYDAIRALRDGPTARYEVCGWGVTDENGKTRTWNTYNHNTSEGCEQLAKTVSVMQGGTAHPIYKRVGGAK